MVEKTNNDNVNKKKKRKELLLISKKKKSFPNNNKNNNNDNSNNAFLLNTHCWHRLAVIHDSYHFCFCWHAVAMREPLRCVRAQRGSLASSPPRACAYLPLYIIRPYSQTSRDASGLPGPGRSFFFFLLPRVGSSPERPALPARISAPRCVTTIEAAMGGWKDGRTDVVT